MKNDRRQRSIFKGGGGGWGLGIPPFFFGWGSQASVPCLIETQFTGHPVCLNTVPLKRYGEPVYFTLGDQWFDLWRDEIFVHGDKAKHNRYIWYGEHPEYSAPKFWDKYFPDWIRGKCLIISGCSADRPCEVHSKNLLFSLTFWT